MWRTVLYLFTFIMARIECFEANQDCESIGKNVSLSQSRDTSIPSINVKYACYCPIYEIYTWIHKQKD